MRKLITYLIAFSFVFTISPAKAENFDPEAISQVSKAIAEWKLTSKDKEEEPPVYVSSSLGKMVEKGSSEGTAVVSGLAAFGGEHRPVKTAIDYYYQSADMVLDSARPNNWVWKGIQATGYDVVGKFIEHFPVFSPLSIENHTVTAIDPMGRYTTLERFGAGVGLAGDVMSPFSNSILKGSGRHLLKQQVGSAGFQRLYKSTEFLDHGTRFHDTIGNLNKVYSIGVDALNLQHNAVRQFPVTTNTGIGRWNNPIGISTSSVGSGIGNISALPTSIGSIPQLRMQIPSMSPMRMQIPLMSPMRMQIPSIPPMQMQIPSLPPMQMPSYGISPLLSSSIRPKY